MFEILSEKLGNVFRLLGNRGRLTEKDIDEAIPILRKAIASVVGRKAAATKG